MTVAKNALLAEGSGRRYMRMLELLGLVWQTIGPSTNPPRWKSAPAGIGKLILTLPYVRICVELTTGSGLGKPASRQSAPSNTNNGSFAGWARANSGVTVQPSRSTWHVPHVRPLTPKFPKNGF